MKTLNWKFDPKNSTASYKLLVENLTVTLNRFCPPRCDYHPLINNRPTAFRTPLSEATRALIAHKHRLIREYHKNQSPILKAQRNRISQSELSDMTAKILDFVPETLKNAPKRELSETGLEKFLASKNPS